MQFYMMTRKLANDELKRKSISEFKSAEKIPVVVMLDDIRSMNNVGSVFRTSDAFLVERIILTGITARPPHREIQKTALGATESVAWEYEGDIEPVVKRLKEEGYTIVAVEQVEEGITLQDFHPEPEGRYVLIFGNEVFGVKNEVVALSDVCVEIPQFGTKHSLNISVSAGIVLWDLFVKIRSLNQKVVNP
jgi:tRNA G18 (ribose-2'-O)-methylase SpoU